MAIEVNEENIERYWFDFLECGTRKTLVSYQSLDRELVSCVICPTLYFYFPIHVMLLKFICCSLDDFLIRLLSLHIISGFIAN